MDPAVILAQLLRGREIKIESGRFKFTFVRPDEMELIRMSTRDGVARIDLALLQEKCVGWEGVLESDILVDGASDPVAFNKVLYAAWIADRSDLWEDLGNQLAAKIESHRKRIEALKGN